MPEMELGLQTGNTSHRPEGCEVQGHGAGEDFGNQRATSYRQASSHCKPHMVEKMQEALWSLFPHDILGMRSNLMTPNPSQSASVQYHHCWG